mgnify:CR=1|tara:strand:- start:3348 stop:4505 length:1158 start_codon:yes stop_codon:yes gene_type:complete
MAIIPIYPGSSSFFPGDTPFGFYDYQQDFQTDADRVVTYCSRRLGYPIMDVELQDLNFYTAFEEAITTYGNELYAYKVRENYLSIEGSPTASNLNHELITPNFASVVRYSEQYGEEAGTGGTTTWYSGSIPVTANTQDYDLKAWAAASASLITGDSIEVKRVFFENTPAIIKFFDPYATTGTGMMNMMENFGFGNYSPAINFMLMPISFDIQKIQAIELSDTVRRSQFSFELINNNLRIFPIPRNNGSIHIQYIKMSERNNPISTTPTGSYNVTNVSNVNYDNPNYNQINSIGRSWIFDYTLALCKEILGYIRGKYTQVPIPGAETVLNQQDLLSASTSEKLALVTRLREYFDETSRDKLLERKAAEADSLIKIEAAVPYPIYIG